MPVRTDTQLRSRRRVIAQTGSFVGHRSYVAGDDLRLVDWNAFARTGELFLRVLEDEERRTLTVLVDTTGSMAATTCFDGRAAEVAPRFTGALRLAAILACAGLVTLDEVQIAAAASPEVARFERGARIEDVLAAIEALRVGGQETPRETIGRLRQLRVIGRGGRFAWITDSVPVEDFRSALLELRRSGQRAHGLIPELREDRNIDHLRGWIRLHDPEANLRRRLRVDAPLREAMREELSRLRREQDRAWGRAGHELSRFPLPANDDFRLTAWREAAAGVHR